MTIFKQARIKLTALYLLIIMFVSVSFSGVVYSMIAGELERIEEMQSMRIQRWFSQRGPFDFPDDFQPLNPNFRIIDPEILVESKRRLLLLLILVNTGILGVSAAAGYFLAGKTLKPIQDMIDEQSQFVADASHELRTPLTALKTEIEVNLRDKKLNLEDAKTLLSSNLEEVNHLQQLSDNLIKLTNISANQPTMYTTVDLEEIVQIAVKKIKPLATKQKITIHNHIKEFSLKGDAKNLIELFIVLLDNAIKYSPKDTEIWLQAEKADGHIIITVRDQGFGISKKDITHIFDRFYRSDQSRSSDGYGLGLAIAKQIVKDHRGTIKVDSELGKGSVFTIKLPVK